MRHRITNIGAPGSIARYCATASWGSNAWAVMAYNQGQAYCVASQTTKEGAQRYMGQGCFLIDLSTYKDTKQ